MTATYLKETISYIIDHFKAETRKHFNLSFLYCLVCLFWILLIVFVYEILAGFTFHYLSSNANLQDLFDKIMMRKLGYGIWYFMRALSILCFGLYGSFVISSINDVTLKDKEKYTWADLKNFISADEWKWFLTFLFAIVVIYFITYKGILDFVYADDGVGRWGGELYEQQTHFSYRLLRWIDMMIVLIREYLPYFLSILFIVTVYENKLNMYILRKYKDSILTGMILAFVINRLSYILLDYFRIYFVGLLDVVFYTSITQLIPMLIRFAMALMAIAYVNWMIAASFCLPIKLQSESQYEINGDPGPDTETMDIEEQMDIQPDDAA